MHTAELAEHGPQVDAALATLVERDAVNRIWARDPSLWKPQPDHQAIIRNSLGWLTVPEFVRSRATDLARFSTEVAQAGFTHVVLLGMGGSSLCADVLRLTFGPVPDHPALLVLDTTDPASVRAAEAAVDLPRTLFIVASKSGTTPEIDAFHRYFFARAREAAGDRAGRQFIAITDPGTALERSAAAAGFRRVFLNPTDIGGRYSALSYFGMVPATLMGVDALKLLEPAERMARSCRATAPSENPGLVLGATLGALAGAGRDKVTFLCAPAIASFGYWVEQLLAESTGKEGLGIVPVEGEAPGEPGVYGSDRLFVHLRLEGSGDAGLDAAATRLARAGHPVVTITLAGAYDLGAEFFRWEFATAVAGAVLQIDPFDQPNVQESKDNTKRLLQEFKEAGTLPEGKPIAGFGPVRLYADGRSAEPLRGARTLAEALRGHLGGVAPGDYVAFTAYLQAAPQHAETLAAMRVAVRNGLRVATTLGYGPRFLHSTGQLHKGGPETGVFLQLTADDPVDVPIPGEPHTFGVMKAAQALGDLQSLQRRERRAVRLHIAGPAARGLDEVATALQAALDRERPA
jgi:glucose-6-phosphate isomerase